MPLGGPHTFRRIRRYGNASFEVRNYRRPGQQEVSPQGHAKEIPHTGGGARPPPRYNSSVTTELALRRVVRAPAAVARPARVHGADELTYFRLTRLLESIGLAAERATGGGTSGTPSPAVTIVVTNATKDWKVVAKLRPGADTVVLTSQPSASDERRALELGAIGYVSLHLDDEALRKRLDAIVAGEAGFSRTALGHWLRNMTPRVQPVDTPPLTPRQRQILERVARGDADKQIAQRLGIATSTVQKHVQLLLRRLGARNRAAAVRYARAPGADDLI